MGMKDWFDKIKGDVDEEMYDDEYLDEEDGVEEIPETTQNSSASSSFRPSNQKSNYGVQRANMQMLVVEPKAFEESSKMADALRQLRPVVINFENTDAGVTARIVDFISGVAYALDGHIEQIGKDIFLCVPRTVSIDKDSKQALGESVDMPNWKESGL